MEFLSKTGRRRPRAGGHCFATKGRSHCAEQEGNGWGEELRRRPWVPVNCEMLPLRDASSLCVSVDSSCKQRACEFGLTPDVGFRRATSRGCYLSGMLPAWSLGRNTWSHTSCLTITSPTKEATHLAPHCKHRTCLSSFAHDSSLPLNRQFFVRHVLVALVLAMRLNRWLKKLSGSLLPLTHNARAGRSRHNLPCNHGFR